MTKRAQIEELYRQGKTRQEIIAAIGCFPGYVYDIIGGVKNPGKKRRNNKAWRLTHPKQRTRNSKRVTDMHQKATLPIARNHKQRWTLSEIQYLQDHGQEQTIHEIALKLGRSYCAVLAAGQTYGVDLRGNKIGAGAIRFKGTYKKRPLG